MAETRQIIRYKERKDAKELKQKQAFEQQIENVMNRQTAIINQSQFSDEDKQELLELLSECIGKQSKTGIRTKINGLPRRLLDMISDYQEESDIDKPSFESSEPSYIKLPSNLEGFTNTETEIVNMGGNNSVFVVLGTLQERDEARVCPHCHSRMHIKDDVTCMLKHIMALQMRPHFIHNTLMSIYYLCKQDPAEAQRVTLDFNNYLEKNLNALASDETIPFSEELEHTVAYLNVEQALYDENLFVEYDTPHTAFRVPPLTLQPIVENAVKHGLDPDSEPLFISVQTRKTDSGSEIIVSDNGPGFEPADDDKPHIALAIIRQRLEMMCRGEMTIMQREGGGTVVRLIIPDKSR